MLKSETQADTHTPPESFEAAREVGGGTADSTAAAASEFAFFRRKLEAR